MTCHSLYDRTYRCRWHRKGIEWPVTTKAQQKAENALNADNAEAKSAVFIGVFAKAVKNLVKQKGVRVPPSAP